MLSSELAVPLHTPILSASHFAGFKCYSAGNRSLRDSEEDGDEAIVIVALCLMSSLCRCHCTLYQTTGLSFHDDNSTKGNTSYLKAKNNNVEIAASPWVATSSPQ